MKRGLVLEFTKMHGAGNDFIVIDNRFFAFSDVELSEIARKYCPRHFGIGADGLLALEPPRSQGHDYYMAYFNADGSLGEMCGNGARCLAQFAREAGFESNPLRFGTVSGHYLAYHDPKQPDTVRIIFPAPTDIRPGFSNIKVGSQSLDLSFVLAGVPHAVWFGDNIDSIPVPQWGSRVRHHDDFVPVNGANVDFVQLHHNNGAMELKVRCYERGVEGETLACGTGAVSSFVAAEALGLVADTETTIVMPGGRLRVGYTADRTGVFLEGNATTVYRGTVELVADD